MPEGLDAMHSIPKIAIAAFCETPEVAAALEAAATDRRLARANVAVNLGGVPAAIAQYRDAPSPNLIVVESRSDQVQLYANLETLAQECVTGTKVIVIGHVNDIGLYRELQERGVSDYLVAPLEPMALIASVARTFRGAGEQKLGRITAFMGARGGAGSSTIAHNVAESLARRSDPDVVLADLDLPFGTVDLDFDLESAHGMADVLQGAERIDEVLLDRLAAKRGERLHVLAGAAAFDRPYEPKESDMERLLDVARSSARHLVLDLPQNWASWTRRALLNADEIVITAAPDLVSMRNAKGMTEYLSNARPNDAPPRLVLNQIGMPKRPEIKPADFAVAVQVEVSACIQFDAQLFGKAANDGRMVVEAADKSEAARAINALARIVSGQKEGSTKGQQPLRRLMGRVMGVRA